MGTKYFSSFTGAEIDASIKTALKLTKETAFDVIESAYGSEADLNSLKKPGIYIIRYYKNSADDSKSSDPIILKVNHVTDTSVEQVYVLNGETQHRYYIDVTKRWTEWVPSKEIISIDASQTVIVGKPTMILRHGGSDVYAEPLIPKDEQEKDEPDVES